MAEILISAIAMLLSSIGSAQTSTNPPSLRLLVADTSPTNSTISTNPADSESVTNRSQLIPLVVMRDVPIGSAIANLAHEAGINYMIDPRLIQKWADSKQPTVTFRLQNIIAMDVLQRMLAAHNLALVENPLTGITRITSGGQNVNLEDTSLLASLATNSPAIGTNTLIPLVQFSDVPVDVALDHLIRYSGIKFEYAPQLQDKFESPGFASLPTVFVRWEKITALQAIFALCENYDLTIVKDDATGILQIKPK